MLETNQVYNLDCLELLKRLPNNSVDLIVTDPPYNIGKDFDNEDLSKEEYISWCKKWIKESIRVLDIGGAFYLSLGWQVVAEIKTIFNDIESIRLKNWIIWYRQDGWKSDNGFAHSHEHILYFIKDNIPLFDLDEFGKHIKEKRLEAGFKTISEFMEKMGLYKKVKRTNGTKDFFSGAGWFESGKKMPSIGELIRLNELLDLDKKYQIEGYKKKKEIDPKKFNVFFNKVDVCDDVWLNPKSAKKRDGHPTQKPVKLFERIIKASSKEGDIVLDFFAGSGTTAIACRKLNRRFICGDSEQMFCRIIEKRLSQKLLNFDSYELNKPEVNICLPQDDKQEGGNGIPPTNEIVGILPKRL